MASIDLVILFLWTLHCGGTFEVQQISLIQTAFASEKVNTTCKTVFHYQKENLDFDIIYYRIDSRLEKIKVHTSEFSEVFSPEKENQTVTKICNIAITPTEHASASGAYYCHAKWKHKEMQGMGTFFLFRDKGYAGSTQRNTMWMCLITFTIVLAVVSIVGTVLLFWKREVVFLRRKQVEKHTAQGSEPQFIASRSEPSGSLYAALGPQEPDIYTVIDDKPTEKEKPTPKVSYQKSQEEIYDNVYEYF